jgi:transposase
VPRATDRLLPAIVATELEAASAPAGSASGGGAIEIEFVAGVRMRITGAVDAATLTAAIAALADGRPR